jgi:hypothetical protein
VKNKFVRKKIERLFYWLAFAIPGIAAYPVETHGSVLINEIHYNSDVKTELVEFIELHNSGSTSVALGEWSLSGGVSFTFPAETTLAPGGYLVIAENPGSLRAKFGATALGPWIGKLSNEGEQVELRNGTGQVMDEVDYQLGFPWPTVGDPPGYSIELVNPAFDNNLGGSWRASAAGTATVAPQTLIADRSSWKYFKGQTEASAPTSNWRLLNFNDSSWLSGAAPFGYGENFLGTTLGDMQGGYTSVFLRKTFQVSNPSALNQLQIEALLDDGFNVWINGVHVLSRNMPGNEVAFNGTANSALEDLAYQIYSLPPPANYLVAGLNVVAIQAHNSSLAGSSDFFIDIRLKAETGGSNRGPTPGARNSVFADNIPPQIRQADHSPEEPSSGQSVKITAKITDPEGVRDVNLQYQIIEPGNYIELSDAAYQTSWLTVAMNDAGSDGDDALRDDIFTAVLPASVQAHRRLVRYRISATDGSGRAITVPYADDPQPNFAYFVYDGVPPWSGAIQPTSTDPNRNRAVSYGTNVMRRLPVYHLIAKPNAVQQSQFGGYAGDQYNWAGTLVYDGKVYDHIHYRARGGVWRYAMGKNMWKFDFNRGHSFEPRDNYGKKYGISWDKLNLGACIQQGDYQHRGEQGMFESVGFRLFNLAGVESPKSHFVQFRVIDGAAESNPASQYDGDFWGLYLAIEQEDSRFLDEHGMPDGNLYKMEGGTGELNNQGAMAVSNKSDLNSFLSTYRGTTPTDDWWRANFDLPRYYSYQTIVQGIHHYDICYGKNYFYFLNPETRHWSVHSWDLDLTWADNMYDAGCGGVDDFTNRVLKRPAFTLEYRNRIRELRDLLFNSDQAHQLIDEYAAIIDDPGGSPSFVDADRALWDYNPILVASYVNRSKAGQGRFYQVVPTRDFPGMVNKMKNYVNTRGAILDNSANDPLIPSRPSISVAGPSDFPANRLAFRASAYSGANSFAAMKWRVGEITATNNPAFDPGKPRKYEIVPTWESPELTNFTEEISIPPTAVEEGHTYRARVRMKDSTGRWSKWSEPVQFVTAAANNTAALVDNLRISEVMFNPPGGSDLEFIELHNTSPTIALDLNGVTFTQGIDFAFPPGTTIPAGGYLLVVKGESAGDFSAFRSHYGLNNSVPIAGPYAGSLDNNGEPITLKTPGAGADIVSFQYGDGRGWPLAADGAGHSLVPLEITFGHEGQRSLNYPGNWRASSFLRGSPGKADPAVPSSVVLNEIVAHTDYDNPARPEYDSNDWIELYNPTAANIQLNAWYLSDDPAELKKWPIPATAIPSRGWVVFDEISGFHNPITTGFGLDKAGEQVLLSFLPGTAEDRVADAVRFKGQVNDVSVGRFPDGGGFWQSLPPTPRSKNGQPIAQIVIGELMYHPKATPANPEDNSADEYVEIFNPTSNAVALYDTNGVWRLDGGVQFTFTNKTTLAAGARLLVVNFNPADAAALNGFRSTYGLTGASIPILGPYQGKLNNSSDRVALERPQYPDVPNAPFSWVIVDEIIYGDQAPWPSSADATGHSLHRLASGQTGNDSNNWTAASPTPGTAGGVSIVDSDGDGMPDSWETAHGLNPNSSGDASADLDGDGLTNLQEYLSGSDPRDGKSALRLDAISFSAGQAVLRFSALAGKSYSVQYKDSLSGGTWITLRSFDPQSSTQATELSDAIPPNTLSRFYRLTTPKAP